MARYRGVLLHVNKLMTKQKGLKCIDAIKLENKDQNNPPLYLDLHWNDWQILWIGFEN